MNLFHFILKLISILKGKFHNKFIYLLAFIGGGILTQNWWPAILESILKEHIDIPDIPKIPEFYGFVLIAFATVLFIAFHIKDPLLNLINKKKNKDCESLTKILRHHHTMTIQNFIDLARNLELYFPATQLWESFSRVIESNNINFYDKKLEKSIRAIYNHWRETYVIAYPYTKTIEDGRTIVNRQKIPSNQRNLLLDEINKLDFSLKELYEYIHEKYICINLDELDKIAWEKDIKDYI